MLISTAFVDETAVAFRDHKIFFCDMVANWGVCNTTLFHHHQIAWDPQFKIGSEHLDFFLTLKNKHPNLKVAYWPEFQCTHAPVKDEAYRALRDRDDSFAAFSRKWDLNYLGVYGGALRRFREALALGHRPEPNIDTVPGADRTADHRQQLRSANARIAELRLKLQQANRSLQLLREKAKSLK